MRLPPLRGSNQGSTGADDTDGKNVDILQRMANVPILGIFVRFARWVASIFRSILIVRMTVLCQAMAQLKTALLDPERRLVGSSATPDPLVPFVVYLSTVYSYLLIFPARVSFY